MNIRGLAVRLTVLVWGLWAVAGCTSIDKRVEQLVLVGQYKEAREVLEADEAGAVVSAKAQSKPEVILAREIFQDAVENEYSRQTETQLSAGLARMALQVSTTGLRLCEWSTKLQSLRRDCETRVAAIDAAEERLVYVLGAPGNRKLRSDALKATQPLEKWLSDSQVILSIRQRTQEKLIDDVLSDLPANSIPTIQDRPEIFSDLTLAGFSETALAALNRAFHSLDLLADSACTDPKQLMAFAEGLADLSRFPAIVRAFDLCSSVFDRLSQSQRSIEPTSCSLEVACALHNLLAVLTERYRSGCETLLNTVLTQRATTLVSDPETAPLSWIYLQAAKPLSTDQAVILRLVKQAEATLAISEPFNTTIALDVGPSVEPLTHEILTAAIFRGIANASHDRVIWNWSDPVHDKPVFRITIDEAILYAPRLSDLTERNSRYLSHHEDVPNPLKAALEGQLSSQDFAVDLAKSSFESAVRSHNIYPTEYSLIRVNSDRTRYAVAVDRYNALVAQYNSTPDTVSQPVYLPYVFREGMLRAGLQTAGRVSAGTLERRVALADVASDYMRVGTKFNDISVASRRDDSLQIPTDLESQIRRITAVARAWVLALGELVATTPRTIRSQLPVDEARLLAWATSPFGPSEQTAKNLELPSWLVSAGLGFRYPRKSTSLTPIHVKAAKADTNEKRRLQAAAHSFCEVLYQSVSGASLGHGSGALVSGDGLVLTCAHVLAGPRIVVRFPEGPNKGDYSTEVVRINEACDVALIRAVGLKSDDWLSISEVEVGRGTEVLAITSPSLGPNAVAHSAVTKGVVISQMGDEAGQVRLVAELAIASGSSGGPVIELTTGKIIGVVTDVSAAEFNESRASTATFCLAAPASRLQSWLGVEVVPGD